MKIFVTGATGFIGKILVQRLLKEGHEVHALYRNPSKQEKNTARNLHYIEGDILDEPSLKRGMQNCEVVFHLAAFAKLWDKDPESWKRINIDGTDHVIKQAKLAGVERCIITSTAGVFGPSIDGIVTEETKRTVPFLTPYEKTKAISEENARKAASRYFEVIIVNPTRVYGPGELSESNGVTRMVKMYVQGGYKVIPGNGKSIGNYVFVDDVINGHILALKYGINKESYLLGGENADFNTFFQSLAEVSEIHKNMIHVPTSLLGIAASSFELWTKLSGQPPLITKQWLERFMYNWNVSSHKAIQGLGYQPTSLKVGLQKTVSWLKTN